MGDLPAGRWEHGLTVARTMARLRTPTLLLPGNHDGVTFPQLAAEALARHDLGDRLSRGMEARVAALTEALGPVMCRGYAAVDVADVRVVFARPHSFGGPTLAFRAYLERTHGVRSLADSRDRLVALFEDHDGRDLLVLAHNGPTGLGDARDSMFGRDFHPAAGDWGDPDLGEALDHAAEAGLPVRAVVAGHMHLRPKGGGRRPMVGRRGDVVVVNAARVPRIDRAGRRHHVQITLSAGSVGVDEVVVEDGVVHRTDRSVGCSEGPRVSG